jgi:hypothetical protein
MVSLNFANMSCKLLSKRSGGCYPKVILKPQVLERILQITIQLVELLLECTMFNSRNSMHIRSFECILLIFEFFFEFFWINLCNDVAIVYLQL